MRPITTFFIRILLPAFCLVTQTTVAQQTLTVRMDGARMRQPLDAATGQTLLQLCQLTPGQTYTAILTGAAEGQVADFRFSPAESLRQSAPDVAALPGKKNALRFTATAECAEFRLDITSARPVSSVPFFLSVKCESCPEANAWSEAFAQRAAGQAGISVGTSTAQNLVNNVLVGGNCFQVANITSFGNANSRGVFGNGSNSIGIDQGIVLSTGNINALLGPNNEQNASGGFSNNSPDDGDLAWLANGNQYDLSVIEFDFTPTAANVQFDFVFGSEEYCEYVGTMFNDVFGFFISGPGIPGNLNIGTLPGSGDGVTINNVNHITNSGFYVNNNNFIPCILEPVAAPNDCELDGWTTILTAQAQLIPCQTYHIKLAIADVSDPLFSSAVFLRANSFDAGGEVSVAPVYHTGQSAVENCGSNFIRFTRTGADNSQPLPVNFTIDPSSTATAGADYAPLSSPVIIPAGTNEILLPISIFTDTLAEGQETLVLAIDNACSCNQSLTQFFIRDLTPLDVTLNDVTICQATSTTLTPTVTGGEPPLSYLWNTGDTTATLVADTSGIFIFTATDACGQSVSDTAVVSIGAEVSVVTTIEFCPGDSVTLGGVVYTGPAIVFDTLPAGPDGCDTLLQYNLKVRPNPLLQDTIALCPGVSVELGGTAYTAPATVNLTLPGEGGACDTLATYVLTLLSNPSDSVEISFCAGSSVTIGDSTYTEPATVQVVVPGQNGACDTLTTYTLVIVENPTTTFEISFCAGSSVTIGDSTYTQATTVETIVPGQNGACDTLATYVLQLLPQVTRTETASLCPGASINIGGTAYFAPDTVIQTLPGAGSDCDTVVTHVLLALPQPTSSTTIELCPGNTVTLGGTAYTAPDTVVLTLPGAGEACDTLATYVLGLLPNPTFTDTITFCPGDSISIGGNIYTQPGTVTDTVPDPNGGCDLIGFYTLQWLTPAPSLVKILCPLSLNVTIPAGNTGEVVTYAAPEATSDCPCPGMMIEQTSGLLSGSTFPVGNTQVCFTAEDACGNSAVCCFNVQVEEAEPCDVKVLGCMRWELLTITQDALFRKTYRIRFKNSCTQKMAYALIQLPNGVVADAPVNNSIYTAPSGRTYEVRNPNSTFFYSIRFRTLGADSIANGQSDIFRYTLPPQSAPQYIHVAVRLGTRLYYEAHLNTFYCPIGITPPTAVQPDEGAGMLRVFPNPGTGDLCYGDLSAWAEQTVQGRIFDAQGRAVHTFTITAEYAPQALPLPRQLANGLYVLEISAPGGERQSTRFVVQR